MCKYGSTPKWGEGTVLELWPVSFRKAVDLISVEPGGLSVPVCDCVRTICTDSNHTLQIISHHLKYGDPLNFITDRGIVLADYFDIMVCMCAKFGNYSACGVLFKFGASPYAVDSKGLNLVQIAVMNRICIFNETLGRQRYLKTDSDACQDGELYIRD